MKMDWTQDNDGFHTKRLLFTIQETAQMCGMSESTLMRHEREGQIRAFRFKRTVRFSWDEIQKFITLGVAA